MGGWGGGLRRKEPPKIKATLVHEIGNKIQESDGDQYFMGAKVGMIRKISGVTKSGKKKLPFISEINRSTQAKRLRNKKCGRFGRPIDDSEIRKRNQSKRSRKIITKFNSKSQRGIT